jgi:hypothetical protein
MQYVTEDMMGLVAEICGRRLAKVVDAMSRLTAGVLDVTPEEHLTMQKVAEVHNRFCKGDYRMSVEEWGYVRDLCNWLAVRWAESNQQPIPEPIEFDEAGLWTQQCRAPNTYDKIFMVVTSGKLDGETG